MKTTEVIDGLAALAQKSRLAVFRHLVQAGPPGSRPGDIAEALGVSASTLSFHLKALSHAGLVSAEQDGRSIIYRADFAAMQGLVDYLTDNCCGGDASLCAPKCAPARAPRSAALARRMPSRN
jgi:DNA-binding transcriptional ArsR family regulator